MTSESTHQGLTLIGLGPVEWESLTLEASKALLGASELHVPRLTASLRDFLEQHVPNARVSSFDDVYPEASNPAEADWRIAMQIVERVEAGENIVFAAPGTLGSGDPAGAALAAAAVDRGLEMRVVPGLGYGDRLRSLLKLSGALWIESLSVEQVLEQAEANAVGQVPGSEKAVPWRAPVPTAGMMVAPVRTQAEAEAISGWLMRFYPGTYPVQVVRGLDAPGAGVDEMSIADLGSLLGDGGSAGIFVPPLDDTDNVRTFPGVMQLTRRLRAPGGCPWDREQTHASLKPHLLEETYEVLDALDSEDPSQMVEEFGDLLFQITIHSQVAAEHGEFAIEDVFEQLIRKLIGRHPHVFGDLELENAQDVRSHWETFKQREKPKRSSVLEGIPRGLPALPQSNLIQKRAASVGFEWPGLREVIDKVREELDELEVEVANSVARDEQREEYGDILFALVSVARHLKLDPEEALRLANRKFAARFEYVEGRAKATGATLRELSPEQIDEYWQEAKALGTSWRNRTEAGTE